MGDGIPFVRGIPFFGFPDLCSVKQEADQGYAEANGCCRRTEIDDEKGVFV